MTLAIISLVIGLVILVIGADILVKGAGALAKRFGVSQTVVGLTVVAFGTSAPELVVNITAALSGDTDIAIGNVVGSNIANILLILGISAMFATLRVERSTTWKEVPFAALAIIMLFVLGNDRFFDGGTNNTL
ncbi:MAG TPA: hypothetical protein PK765_01375 [bacterium]|nr:hypothetical protein [bacterium]